MELRGWRVFPISRGGRGWSLMIFCARATRGLRRPSLDARIRGSTRPLPKRSGKTESPEKDTASCPSCSQNVHDRNMLVRCAQERAAWPLFLREVWEIEDSWKDTHVGPVLLERAP